MKKYFEKIKFILMKKGLIKLDESFFFVEPVDDIIDVNWFDEDAE